MRYNIFLFCIIFISVKLTGQTVPENLPGKVSFISPQNIYIRFATTEGISAGDTLYITTNGKLVPVLIVNNLSSVSCVCTPLPGASLSVAQNIIARKKTGSVKPEQKVIENAVEKIPVNVVAVDSVKKQSSTTGLKQKIYGSLSAYSYSDFSNTSAANSTQFRYSLSLDARNISSSKLSVSSYISFRNKLGDWSAVKSNVFNALKIYNLALRYDLNKTTQISVGRKLNPRISSMGAVDGLQVEKSINNFALGAVVGSRPDFADYGFNGKLFQYGAYVAFSTKTANIYSESSMAFMQQMNNWKTDRRFLYFQHSNSLIKNTYFFSTFEIDLYKIMNGQPQNTFDLTGLYLSLRYKMTKNFTITGSYDARKNVMYYETYRSLFDSVLINETRQSFRVHANYSITKELMLGLESGYRFLKSDPHPSKNVNGYLTYSRIPGLNCSGTISATYLESNYLKGEIVGVSIFRDLFNGNFQAGIGYRYVNYKLPENLQNDIQNIGEMNIYWQFSRYMSFAVNYEGTFDKHDKYNRLNLQIRKRF